MTEITTAPADSRMPPYDSPMISAVLAALVLTSLATAAGFVIVGASKGWPDIVTGADPTRNSIVAAIFFVSLMTMIEMLSRIEHLLGSNPEPLQPGDPDSAGAVTHG